MHLKHGTLIILVAVFLLVSPPSVADKDRYISLDRAVSQVRQQTGGRVLSAETRQQNGRPVHHIRILSEQGKVLRYRVDARSGKRIR